MKIVLCNWRDLAHPASGGAEVFTHQVLTRWAAWGHDVTWVCAHVDGAPADEVIDGVRVVRGGSRLGVYGAARRWLTSQSVPIADVVIDEINTVPFRCHRWLPGTPVVALAHQVAREVWSSELPWPVAAVGRYVMEPWWLRQFRFVPTITVSASSRESLEKYGLQRVSVVEPPRPEAAVPNVAKFDSPTAVFVGRLAANKRPDHALRAIDLARRTVPDLRLLVVGDGELGTALRRSAGPHVEILGRLPEADKQLVMARSHLLVATSVREGWGMVVDEAAAMGTPTIAYDVAGLRDSVRRAGGWLVDPHPASLAAAIADAFGDRREELNVLSFQRSWDDVAGEMLDVVTAARHETLHPFEHQLAR